MDPSKQRLMDIVIEMLIHERARVAALCELIDYEGDDVDAEVIGLTNLEYQISLATCQPDLLNLRWLVRPA